MSAFEFRVRPGQGKKIGDTVRERIRNARERFKPKLLERMRENSPYETGALARSHFVRSFRGTGLGIVFGFKETEETKERSISRTRPDGIFYGMFLHEGVWPIGKNFPDWVPISYEQTSGLFKRYMEEEIEKRLKD